jgi:phenylalanyl-tRNA synthetase beta chain
MNVSDADVERILQALGMQISHDAEGWQIVPPTRRFDIAIEEDLIEEVARIVGYETIPVRIPAGEIRLAAPSETKVDDALLRRQLAAHDFQEAINYAFVDARTLDLWQLADDKVAIANPLTSELGVMRTSLLPGLVEALRHNLARQQDRIRLFELGRVFHIDDGNAPRETRRIAAVATGRADAERWSTKSAEVDFYDMKAEVEALFALAGITAEYRTTGDALGHPGRSAEVWNDGRKLGWVGHLHPRLAKALDLDREVVGFELDLDAATSRAIPRAGELSRFPSVRRDIALVVPEATPWAALEASLKSALGPRLHGVVLFDQYRGPGLETGAKSLAMGLILQEVSRTLTDLDADQAVSDAVAALGRDCGATLRG